MVFTNGAFVFATTDTNSNCANNVISASESTTINYETQSDILRGGDADLWAYRKKNVNNSEKWTSYYRVSDNIVTGPKGGSIVSNKSVTVNAVKVGPIYGITVNVGKDISSSIGYTLNAGANQRVYMGYHVYMKIETGTREKYNKVTGAVVETSKYRVEAPQFGEYKLLNY